MEAKNTKKAVDKLLCDCSIVLVAPPIATAGGAASHCPEVSVKQMFVIVPEKLLLA